MRKVARFVFGLRPDLELSNRWWHRLAKVTFTLVTIGVITILVVASRVEEPVNRQNVRILENLRDYNRKHPELASTISSFEALGRVGAVDDSGEMRSYYIPPFDLFCSGNISKPESITELRNFLRGAEANYQISDDDARAFVAKYRETDESAIFACFGRVGDSRPKQSDIVIYEMTRLAASKSWLKASGKAALVTLGWFLVTLNLYYRALVYIICGPRKKQEPAGV